MSNQNIAILISLGSVAIALLSLIFSIYSTLRDSARIRANSKYFAAWDAIESPASVRVTVVNKGRRAVILHMWVGADSNGKWMGTALGERQQGLRLGEHERHEMVLSKEDLLQETPDDSLALTDLWFEDSIGRKHKVKAIRRNLRLLANS